MKLSAALLCALVAVQAARAVAQAGELQVGYYGKKCKGLENVVKWHVIRALKANRRTGAALIRLLFHDCFGCDGSVLLDASYDNPHPEKVAPVNIGLAAFDLMEEIKAVVEDRCPGVVSCSDLLIYAARDASSILSNGHVHFDVPAGHLDSFVSKAEEAQAELQDSADDVQKLITNFARKNFTVEAAAAAVQATAPGTPTVGYYNDKCNGSVEGIVRETVKAALNADLTKGAALVRLFFHDCFVRGCDGSVLLDPTYANPYPEKTSGANIGLRGFDVIDAIKANLESACPSTVSCADILAFAARDTSSNLPGSTFDVATLISNFAAKGFTPEELDCDAGPADPTVENNIRDQNATALGNLTSYIVPARGGASLDNSYYVNSLNSVVLFHSDWAIVGSNATRRHVHEYADNGTLWNLDFADALVKLSKLAMPPGRSGRRAVPLTTDHHGTTYRAMRHLGMARKKLIFELIVVGTTLRSFIFCKR
ncbi:peroxidase 1 precursor [Panicum miliaceum]|uniref:Peroxidase 1 n=1 Tax=Panicum miliaceum TaxID=4540 RepID=A0A3L6R0B8_PANMI|nr:peroxidase 1 precursor [Panicum miliaceum]